MNTCASSKVTSNANKINPVLTGGRQIEAYCTPRLMNVGYIERIVIVLALIFVMIVVV